MREVHFSIDDVVGSLMQVATSPQGLDGSPVFRHLIRLHRLTGMKVTLYVFMRDGEGFGLDALPSLFADYPWIRFGFHGVRPTNQPPVMSSAELDTAIGEVHLCIASFAGEDQLSNIVRMHYWQYPDNYLQILARNGYNIILVKEEGDLPARIPTENGVIITTWRTHVNIETSSFMQIWGVIKSYLQSPDRGQPLVMFTHEWALARQRVIFRLIITIIFLRMCKFNFL